MQRAQNKRIKKLLAGLVALVLVCACGATAFAETMPGGQVDAAAIVAELPFAEQPEQPLIPEQQEYEEIEEPTTEEEPVAGTPVELVTDEPQTEAPEGIDGQTVLEPPPADDVPAIQPMAAPVIGTRSAITIDDLETVVDGWITYYKVSSEEELLLVFENQGGLTIILENDIELTRTLITGGTLGYPGFVRILGDGHTIYTMQPLHFDLMSEYIHTYPHGGVHYGAGGNVYLENVTLAGGSLAQGIDTSAQHGGLKVSGLLEMDGATFNNTHGIHHVVGAENTSSRTNYKNCTFINNSGLGIGRQEGGAILFGSGIAYGYGTTLVLDNCRFEGNTAVDGGALYISYDHSSFVTVVNCTFEDNHAYLNGGAYYDGYVYNGVTITDCSFISNTAGAKLNPVGTVYVGDEVRGGALYTAKTTVTNSTFVGNMVSLPEGTSLPGYGGAIYAPYEKSSNNEYCNTYLLQNDFSKNAAFSDKKNQGGMGGAIYTTGQYGMFALGGDQNAPGKFLQNYASTAGGAIAAYNIGLTIGGYTSIDEPSPTLIFTGNTAGGEGHGGMGGAIYHYSDGKEAVSGFSSTSVSLSGLYLSNNKADHGSAVALHGSSPGIMNAFFEDNGTDETNGALYMKDLKYNPMLYTQYNFMGLYFNGNKGKNGAGLYADGTDPLLLAFSSVAFENNAASHVGGGIYSSLPIKLEDNYSSQLPNSRFINNTSAYGGAIYFTPGWEGNAKVGYSEYYEEQQGWASVRFINNTASVDGGAIWLDWNRIEAMEVDESVVFADNTASRGFALHAAHEAVHTAQVHTTHFSKGYTTGYNNHDIVYRLYRLNYDANYPSAATGTGGSVPDSAEYYYGEEATIQADNGLVADKYRFLGWAPTPGATAAGTDYEAGNTLKMTSDVTLYGVWQKLEEPSTTSSDGGTSEGTSSSSPAGSSSATASSSSSTTTSSPPPVVPPTTSTGSSTSRPAGSSSRAPASSSNMRSSSLVAGGGSSSSGSTTSTPAGSSSTGASPEDSSTAPAVSEPPGPGAGNDGTPSMRLFGTDIPLGSFGSREGWSLLSLLLAVLALLSSFVMLFGQLATKRGKQEGKGKKRFTAPLPALTGLLPLLLFLIVERFTTVVLLNRWTAPILLLFFLHCSSLLVAALYRHRRERPDEDELGQEDEH